jgi:hypothetical protein
VNTPEHTQRLITRVLELEAVVSRLREALRRVEPLIDAQFVGHADLSEFVSEFVEKGRKLNEALDIVREALAGVSE